jgi:hypothetical protein
MSEAVWDSGSIFLERDIAIPQKFGLTDTGESQSSDTELGYPRGVEAILCSVLFCGRELSHWDKNRAMLQN